MSGPRVAQYYMGNSNDDVYKNLYVVSNLGDALTTMPDRTDKVSAYFTNKYPTGKVNYPVQSEVQRPLPATPKDVHPDIHFRQFTYNELGMEAAENIYQILKGEPDVTEDKVTVKYLTWDGYTEATEKTIGNDGEPNYNTLVVPVVTPLYAAKDVTYEFTNGFSYDANNPYDLTAVGAGHSGKLSAKYKGVEKASVRLTNNGDVTEFTITNSTVEHGNVIVDKTSAAFGDEITVKALSDIGYHFDKWDVKTDSGSPITVTDGKFIMPAEKIKVDAIFTPNLTTVKYHDEKGVVIDSKSNIYNTTVNLRPDEAPKQGYTFSWDATTDEGDTWCKFSNNELFVKDNLWIYTGYHENTLDVYANWTVVTDSKPVSGNTATFGENCDVLALHSKDNIDEVRLMNVNQISGTVTLTADNTELILPSSINGHTLAEEISVFDITVDGDVVSTTATFNVMVTFTDEAVASAKKKSVYFFHHTGTTWELLVSTIVGQTDKVVTYTVETPSFSPFGIGIYTPSQQPDSEQQTHSSSSRDYGSSIWLPATAEPTPTPVAEQPTQAQPTVSPVKPTPQASSPAPFVGLLAGLGAAAVFFGLRRR